MKEKCKIRELIAKKYTIRIENSTQMEGKKGKGEKREGRKKNVKRERIDEKGEN